VSPIVVSDAEGRLTFVLTPEPNAACPFLPQCNYRGRGGEYMNLPVAIRDPATYKQIEDATITDICERHYFFPISDSLSLPLSLPLSICLSICLSIYLSVCLSVCVCLSVSLSLCLSVSLSYLIETP
jgi:hypothetical protein